MNNKQKGSKGLIQRAQSSIESTYYGAKDLVKDVKGTINDIFNHNQTEKQSKAVERIVSAGHKNNAKRVSAKMKNFRGLKTEIPIEETGKTKIYFQLGVCEETEVETNY